MPRRPRTGEFLEEDLYEDWASELREEARLTYLQVAVALAGHAGEAGEYVTASRYCLRILERDQYNEPEHLALVRALAGAGSHGEARRRYRAYAAAWPRSTWSRGRSGQLAADRRYPAHDHPQRRPARGVHGQRIRPGAGHAEHSAVGLAAT